MNLHRRDLALRRQQLVARSATQRGGLIANADAVVKKTAAADRVVAALRRHPVMVAAAVSGVVLLGSRRLFDVSERLLTLYLLLRRR